MHDRDPHKPFEGFPKSIQRTAATLFVTFFQERLPPLCLPNPSGPEKPPASRNNSHIATRISHRGLFAFCIDFLAHLFNIFKNTQF